MDNVIKSLSEWIKITIRQTVQELLQEERDKDGIATLNIKQTCQFLGISPELFNEYRYRKDFPKQLPGKRWSRLALIEWLKKQK